MSAGADQYINQSQQNLLAALELMGARPLAVVATSDVATQLGITADQAMRCLHNLALADYVERHGQGRWRLSPKLTRFSERLRQATLDMLDERLGVHDEG